MHAESITGLREYWILKAEVEVCKSDGADKLSPFGPGSGVYTFFYRSDSSWARAHLASLLLLCPYKRRAHMATVWNTDYIINIIHRLHNTQRIHAHISIQVTIDHAEHQGEVGVWGATKSSQCFGKSDILDTMHLMMILTRQGCAFIEKCIFSDFIMIL